MIAAIILAAGRSERMGRPKPVLPVGSATFLDAILRTVERAGIREARVVLGYGADAVRAAVPLLPDREVVNPEPDAGMLSSVRCGIRALPPGVSAFLLWPVDHPLVTSDTVEALVAAFRRGEGDVVRPSHAGRHGHPVLFAASLAEEILAAPDDEGARAVVHANSGRVRDVEVPDPGVLADIDTPEAYDRLVRSLGS